MIQIPCFPWCLHSTFWRNKSYGITVCVLWFNLLLCCLERSHLNWGETFSKKRINYFRLPLLCLKERNNFSVLVPRWYRKLSGCRFLWTGVHKEWQCLEAPVLIGLTAFNLPLQPWPTQSCLDISNSTFFDFDQDEGSLEKSLVKSAL